MWIDSGPSVPQPKNLFSKIITGIVSVVLLALAITFSLVFLAVLVVAGIIFWLYFWWKTRRFRHALENQISAAKSGTSVSHHPSGGTIIEGEAVRLEKKDENQQSDE